MELTKQIIKVGNGAGVLLPREWYGGEARIELIKKPVNISRDIFKILEKYLYDIIGVYLVGSYARNEQTGDSDIDILAISEKTSKNIHIENYSLILISKEELEKSLEENPIYYLPMIKEAKTIVNPELIEKYKKYQLNSKGVMSYIKSTKEALKNCRYIISLDKKLGLDKTGDVVAYSLVLRMRGIYILDSIIKRKLWNKKELIKIIKNKIIYDRYLASKENKNTKRDYIAIQDAEKLIKNIESKLDNLEKWAKEKAKEERGKKD